MQVYGWKTGLKLVAVKVTIALITCKPEAINKLISWIATP